MLPPDYGVKKMVSNGNQIHFMFDQAGNVFVHINVFMSSLKGLEGTIFRIHQVSTNPSSENGRMEPKYYAFRFGDWTCRRC